MARQNNPVLGEIECNGCGGVCSVHQTSRGSGRFLYTRCGECGADQRTGAAIQKRLWLETNWRPDAGPVRPPNVPEDAERVNVQSGAVISVVEPETNRSTTEPKPAPKTPSNQVKRGPLAFFGLVVLGVLAVAS